jgi:hyperosmotically inducible protein
MKNSTGTFAVAIIAAALGAGSATASTSTVVKDSVITAKVKSALVAEPATKARQIDVVTSHGTVQLSGFVDNAESRIAAEKVAHGIKGVVAVQNKLDVRSEERSVGAALDDAVISTKVKAALAADPLTKAMSIAVASDKGTVQLSGTVDSEAERAEAVRVAAGVDGVQTVESKLDTQG